MLKMGKDKHYRMTEESLTFIEKRDKEKYPKENLFVNVVNKFIFDRSNTMFWKENRTGKDCWKIRGYTR